MRLSKLIVLAVMGHDNHTVLSPAHRRNQNPTSPSASLFKRSSTFPRDEPDLSWPALFRRHRFLLLTLALLAFLCTIYLYFAIKLGADNCSGLLGKDEALCRAKKSKVKTSHGHKTRRMLLKDGESTFEPIIQNYAPVATQTDSTAWDSLFIEDSKVKSALVLGCRGKNFTGLFSSWSSVDLTGSGCKEWSLVRERPTVFSAIFLEAFNPSSLFDLIICEKCSMLKFINDEREFWKVGRLLKDKGFFLWNIETTSNLNFTFSLVESLQLHGWSCLSRANGRLLWQKH